MCASFIKRTSGKSRLERLIVWMKDVACLSDAEAICAISGWLNRKDDWSCEAVNHFGGFKAVVQFARQAHTRRFCNRIGADRGFPTRALSGYRYHAKKANEARS